ncbi:alcohol dehydrogenase catalytic domain-containing protein [Saccharomonospora sp. CUA-673]|uniref:alcohol dehydrogenase catalytic domain-containing protein n=1 Tax=Saccharomonospora sp. CUA-673 TaxID=1904969 RepID=UPI002100902E|nr:alcohol dehydrogenase catalytic domain-containing protein [Saccharomonospora sp. CUA-673]
MSTTHTAIGYTANLPATDPESLVVRDVDTAQPGPRDLLVDVRAVSVNPVDRKLRTGAPADGFRVLGFDAAGVVRAVGAEVSLFAPGDEVFYAGTIDRPGTNQRFHLVDERIVGPKPASISFADAASLPLTAITAWETLFDRFRLTEDSTGTLLVVGATGGVGSILLQLAEALLPGVRVIATASDAERQAWVRDLGARTPSTTTETCRPRCSTWPPAAWTGSSPPIPRGRSRRTRPSCGPSARSSPSTTARGTSSR